MKNSLLWKRLVAKNSKNWSSIDLSIDRESALCRVFFNHYKCGRVVARRRGQHAGYSCVKFHNIFLIRLRRLHSPLFDTLCILDSSLRSSTGNLSAIEIATYNCHGQVENREKVSAFAEIRKLVADGTGLTGEPRGAATYQSKHRSGS